MLPAPFYTDLPMDLGDDQTWADHRFGGRHRDELSDRPVRSLRAIVNDRIAMEALSFFSRARRMLAR